MIFHKKYHLCLKDLSKPSKVIKIIIFTDTSKKVFRHIWKLYPDYSELIGLIKNETSNGSHEHLLNPNYLSNDVMQAKVMIGMALSFFSGVIQVNFFLILF